MRHSDIQDTLFMGAILAVLILLIICCIYDHPCHIVKAPAEKADTIPLTSSGQPYVPVDSPSLQIAPRNPLFVEDWSPADSTCLDKEGTQFLFHKGHVFASRRVGFDYWILWCSVPAIEVTKEGDTIYMISTGQDAEDNPAAYQRTWDTIKQRLLKEQSFKKDSL